LLRTDLRRQGAYEPEGTSMKNGQLQDEIYPLPELPDEIKAAVENEELVVFLGAGVSRILECPGWKELADALLETCHKNGHINFWESTRLQQNSDPRKTISIVKEILPDDDYIKFLKSHLVASEKKLKKYPIFERLIKLRAIYVTTNIDTLFDGCFESSKIVIKKDDIRADSLRRHSLVHLHGSISDPASIVFTIREYLEHYNHNGIKDFLKSLFNKTVLFVGYSLSELEVLDHILLKGNTKELKHHLLLPFYRTEKSLLKYERQYFASLNVNVIPYAIDDRGHNQLYHVIEKWEKEINIATPFLHESYRFLEENAESYIEKNADEVLQLLRNDENFRNHFFKKLKTVDWFERLKKEGYFSPDRAPGPIPSYPEGYFSIPVWNVLPYLEKVSLEAGKPGNEKYIGELLKIIKDVTNHHVKHERSLDNYHTWSCFVKILLNLPADKIPLETIGFIREWLTSRFSNRLPGSDVATKLLPKFLDSADPEDWKKAEKIIEIITAIKWTPLKEETEEVLRKKEEASLLVDKHWLLKSFEANTVKIGERCGKETIITLADRLKEILEHECRDEKNDYSYIWFRSLFSHRDRSIYDAKVTLTVLLKNVLLAKAGKDREETKKILDKFMSEEYPYPIFERMVLFVIGSEWDGYRDLFWNIVDSKEAEGLFEDSNYMPELYMVLQRNTSRFAPEEKARIKSVIEKGPSKYLPEKDMEKYIAYWKQRWYSAMKADPDFLSLYEEQREKTQIEEELTFLKEPEVRTGPGPSPLAKEDMLRMSNVELAEFFKTFRTKDFWKGPTVGGLAELLKEAVKDEPGKFVDELAPFMDVGYLYIYKILWGIKDAWNEKKDIEWDKVLAFIKKYMDRDEFWKDKFVIEESDWPASHAGHEWVVGIAAELIQEGTKEAALAMPEACLDEAQEIIFLILDRLKSDKQEETTDFVTLALNTSLGKALAALIYLAFRIAKIKEKEGTEDVKWSDDIRDRYNKVLGDGHIEGYTLLGQYMPTLSYLDKEWLQGKIEAIKARLDTEAVEALMDGYLFGSQVYEDLYKLMRPYYLHFLGHPPRERHAVEKLVQHVSLGYLQGWEEIDDNEGLFRKILDRWDDEQLLEAIGFFWMQRRKPEQAPPEYEKTRERIMDFWKWVYENKFKGVDDKTITEGDKKILSKLALLTVFLEKIDSGSADRLILSARYVNVDYQSSFLIEYLDGFEDDGSIEKTGAIFLEMLSAFTPDYDMEHIRSIVKKLYRTGQKESADKICNIYGSRNYDFLRDIYDANN